MYDYDDYLDYSSGSRQPDRLRLVAYVDGRLVDSWTEPVRGTRWERFAIAFDEERTPPVRSAPAPPRHQLVLQWLDGVVGGREALLALGDDPTAEPERPRFADPREQEAYAGVEAAIRRVAGSLLDADAQRVLHAALALLWREAPQQVTGALTPAAVAGGLFWVVGKANGLFGVGLTQQQVQRELWLKQQLHSSGQAVARQLRGIDLHGTGRPRECPDVMSFARVELLTAHTRRALMAWRDQALAEEHAGTDAAPPPES